jgi:hypothetical protein
MPVSAVPNIQKAASSLPTITHPHYKRFEQDWFKWRLTYEGGDRFIQQYLVKFSNREDNKDYAERKRLSYCPAFAKAAIHEIRNAIYKRSKDITREGGPASYQTACNGKNNGVDLIGSDMNYFMGIKALEELLVLGRVGVYVDMPSNIGQTLKEKGTKRPYIYLYQAEDIRSYTLDNSDNPSEFTSLLLTDHNFDYDQDTGLPTDESIRYRHVFLKETDDGPRVFCRFCNNHGEWMDEFGESADGDYMVQVGNLTKIPFVLLEISTSLLMDAANYQIAHLNLASSDIWYSSRANFPFYIEPFDPKSQSPYIKREGENEFDSTDQYTTVTTTTNAEEITVGPTRGRRYPTGTNQPAFIHPSSEPMKASMAKQDQLKAELRQLINLSLANLNPGSASAESKALDQAGLENGLSYLARIMQYAENRIAYYWGLYEGTSNQAEVQYPEQYELLNPDQVDKEIESLIKLADRTSSITLKKRCMKIIAELKVSSYVQRQELQKIYKEIDDAKVVVADNLSIKNDVEMGLVSLKTASKARGYPDGETDSAADDHAERLARIQAAQTPSIPAATVRMETAQARGLPDQAGEPTAGSKEKAAVADQTKNPTPTDPTRGPGTNGQ